jgi:hypothetical protein
VCRHLAIATLVLSLFGAPMWPRMRGGARAGVPTGRPGFASHGPVMVNRRPMMPSRGAFIGRRLGARVSRNSHGRFFVHDRFFFDRYHHRHRLFFWSYPFYGFYPWYDTYPPYYDDYSYFPGPSSYQAASDSANAYGAANAELANAIARLSDEVEHLREERQPPPALPAKPEAEKNSEPSEPTMLVFRDRHTQEVNNYAVVGSTLWILNERRATKVPLSSLDIDATTKLNGERGVEFRLPE